MSRRLRIELAEMPPVGLSILVDGQRFDLIGHEDHICRDGQPTVMLVWRADCATCCESFVSRTGRVRWAEIRRCEAHRQPGKRVRTRSRPGRTNRNSQITAGECPAGGDSLERISA